MNLWGRSLITSTSFVVAFYFMNLNAHRSIDRSLHLIYAHLLMLYLFNRAVGRSVGRSVGRCICFFKWAKPGLFFVYFRSFQTNNTIVTIYQCEKMSCPYSIWCRDSNQRPLEHEWSPITTRSVYLFPTESSSLSIPSVCAPICKSTVHLFIFVNLFVVPHQWVCLFFSFYFPLVY